MKSIVAFFRRGIDFLVDHEWLVLLLFLVFVLRVPTLFEPNWYGDEEIYLVMGQGLRKGLLFYKDIFDHKPPGIYVLAAITHTVFWFRLLLLFVHGVSVVYFARLSQLILMKKKWMMAATTTYALFSTLPLLEGTIANGENFMTVPALVAMYLIYKHTQVSDTSSKPSGLAVGLLFSMAFLIKVPIVFDLVAGGVFWWLLAVKDLPLKKTVQRFFSPFLWLGLAGFLLPIAISIAYYWSVGAAEPYIRSALLQNIGYIESWRGEATSPLSNPLVWRMLVIGGFSLLVLNLKRFGASRPMLFVSLWTLMAVYGSLLSNRPYPHYLLQPLIPGTLLVFLLLKKLFLMKFTQDLFVGAFGLGIALLMLFDIGFGHYAVWPYYKNFIDYVTKAKSHEEYQRFFPSSVLRNQKIAQYLRERTTADERVFIWGEEPAIYDMADRLPVGRYIVSFHIRDFPGGYDETMIALNDTRPRYIVVIPKQVPSFPRLETLLQTDYVLVDSIEDVLIYKRIELKTSLSNKLIHSVLPL